MDDDLAGARKINDILVAAGYTVYVSTNREGSAALVKRTRPILIIARGKLLDTDACGAVNGIPEGDILRDMSYVILVRDNAGRVVYKHGSHPVYKIADAVRTPVNRKELVSSVRALTAPTDALEKFGRLAADTLDAFDYLLSDTKWSKVYYAVVGLAIILSVAALTFLAYGKYKDKGLGKVAKILTETVKNETPPIPAKSDNPAPPEKSKPENPDPEISDPEMINRKPPENIAREGRPAKDAPETTENSRPSQNDPQSAETPKEKTRPDNNPVSPEKPSPHNEPSKVGQSLKGFYTLRAGAFSKRNNAEKMIAMLNKFGYEAFIRDGSQRDQTPYRVYIGRFKTKDDAYNAKARLEKIKGLKTVLLKL